MTAKLMRRLAVGNFMEDLPRFEGRMTANRQGPPPHRMLYGFQCGWQNAATRFGRIFSA
jgi:hypothetical protein